MTGEANIQKGWWEGSCLQVAGRLGQTEWQCVLHLLITTQFKSSSPVKS